MPTSEVVQWAVRLLAQRAKEAARERKRACKDLTDGRKVHKLRTRVRRLRAALEDLHDCVPKADDWLAQAKTLAECTGESRDAAVLIKRLQRYQRFALPPERADIARLCKALERRARAAQKPMRKAVKSINLEFFK